MSGTPSTRGPWCGRRAVYGSFPVATVSLVLFCSACSSENSGGATDSNGSAKAGSGVGPVSGREASGGRLSSTGKNTAGGAGGSPNARPSSGSSLIAVEYGGANGSVAEGNSGGNRSSGGTGGMQLPGGASSSGVAVATGGKSNTRATDSVGHANQGGFKAAGGAASSSAGGQFATGGSGTTTGVAGSGVGTAVAGPCDIFKSAGTPCVAAHSTVRALLGDYSGKLYQVRRADNTTKDIVTLAPGGFADGPSQDTFCAGSTCVITVVYDQSGKGNDLWYQGSTEVPGSPKSSPAKATTESLTVSGHKVYSLYINPGNSYWRNGSKSGVPTGSEPEGMYMVTSGTHVNGGCCFDYGNSETTRKADAAGAMDAINFSTQCWFGGCAGTGPWVQADLEWGLFPGGSNAWNPSQKAFGNKYVTALLKNNGTTGFALKGGNSQSGSLTTLYEGKLPNGYSPMKKQGAIVLGSGGDCCKPDGGANLSAGTFYEGAIVSGYPSDTIDDFVQSNIVGAGYGSTAASR